MYFAQKFKRLARRKNCSDQRYWRSNAVSRLCLCAPLLTRRFVQTREKISIFLISPRLFFRFSFTVFSALVLYFHTLRNIYIHDINNDEGKWERKNNFALCIYKSKMMYFRHNQKRNLVSLNTFVVVNLWNVAVRVAFRPTIRQDPRPFLTATFVHQIALSSRSSEATFKRRLKKSEQRRGRRRRRTLSMRAHRCVNGRYRTYNFVFMYPFNSTSRNKVT